MDVITEAKAAAEQEAKVALEFWLGTMLGTEPLDPAKNEVATITVTKRNEDGTEYETEENVTVSGKGTYKPVGGRPRGDRHTVSGVTFVSVKEADGGNYPYIEGRCPTKGCEPVRYSVRSKDDIGRVLTTEQKCPTCGEPVEVQKAG